MIKKREQMENKTVSLHSQMEEIVNNIFKIFYTTLYFE